jgi:hypothetical protein
MLPLLLLAGALLAAPPALPARAQQEGSGSVAIAFLTALDAGDIDAAMATWTARPEVELSTGERYDTPEAVRAYFASFLRPIEIVDTLPWGGHRYEARVLADGTPLLLTFEGAMGSIAYMYVEPDPSVVSSD